MITIERELAKLNVMIDDLRAIRERTCEPKDNTNPRYHALSSAISQINRAIADLQRDER